MVRASYGPTFYGIHKTKGTFVCPTEQEPFGTDDTLGQFKYTHYALNPHVAGGPASLNWLKAYFARKMESVKNPSQAIFATDSNYRSSPVVTSILYFGFRHGSVLDDYRANGATTAPIASACVNVSYVDGHSQSIMYRQLTELKVEETTSTSQAALYFGLDYKKTASLTN